MKSVARYKPANAYLELEPIDSSKMFSIITCQAAFAVASDSVMVDSTSSNIHRRLRSDGSPLAH